jgi:diguanylate cyclase (GGDEF)-like protein
MLLSADVELSDLFSRLATLLGSFVDASIVQVAIANEHEAQIAFIFREGAGGRPENPTVAPDGTTARVLKSGEAVLYRTANEWPSERVITLEGHDAERAASAIFVPIRFGGHMVGVLSVQSINVGAYDDEDRALLETCALYLGARIHDEQQRAASETLALLATIDALTSLANRRSFDDALGREWRRCARSQTSLSLAMIDIDFFKEFNDAYGHVAGDACLRQVAQAIADRIKRPGDLAARYGGEEFALVLPDSDAVGSFKLSESVCAGMLDLAITHEGSSLGYVTVSIGVATIVPDVEDDPQGLLRSADAMLYEAKHNGRNRVVAGHLRFEGPEATARVIVRYALPHYVTPIIGRQREIADLLTLLKTSPLVTIVGTGGIGKTRLAVQAALQMVDAQREGTWFADFARVTDSDQIATTIAAAIGFELPPGRDPLETLITMLKPQHMLLVLDNCEHVIEGAARLTAAIVGKCPQVRIIATSREPLGIEGESVYRLDTLDDASALELFVARARRADQRFPLTAADTPLIAEICSRLDGVALAIELAAARAHVMPLEQLRTRLDERFRLLTGGNRTALPRQQTLLASIGWSYDLLSYNEQTLFRRLGVFSSGFTLEAATRVAADDSIAAWEVVDGIAALIDKSMLERSGAGTKRYRMLDSIRQYAVQRLCEADEEQSARRSHAAAFAALSDDAAASYGHITQSEWLARYEPDLDNFRAALDWATAGDLSLAARITGNLPEFWDYCGVVPESLRRSEAVLVALEHADSEKTVPVLLAIARLSNASRHYRRGLEAGERAYALAQHLGDPLLIARALHHNGGTRCILDLDRERGISELQEALTYFRTQDNVVHTMGTLNMYGWALDPAVGRPLVLDALALANASGWPRIGVNIEMNLAERDFWESNISGAIERATRAISMLRTRRSALDLTIALGNLASYFCIAGEYGKAHDAAAEAAAIACALDLAYSHAIASQSLAVVFAVRDDARGAAQLLGYINAWYEKLGTKREQTETLVYEHLLSLLRNRLDEATLSAEIASGSTMSMPAAHAFAQGERSSVSP